MKPGAVVGLGFARKAMYQSLPSLSLCETEDAATFLLSFQLPSEFFIATEGALGVSHLYCKGRAQGEFERFSLNVGSVIMSRPHRKIGWQFFESTMRYSGEIRQYLQWVMSQELQYFRAGEEYFGLLDRTRRASPLTARLELGLPFTYHLGLRVIAGIGQDSERGVKMGKVLTLNSSFMWVLNHRSKCEFSFRHSTENTGVIKGDITEIGLRVHVNM